VAKIDDITTSIKSLSDLDFELREAEKKKIGFVEATLLVFFALAEDIIQLIPLFIGEIIASPITIGLLVWTIMRDISGRFFVRRALKITFYVVANAIDIALDGWLPIATIVMIIVIFLNNRVSEKTLKQLDDWAKKNAKRLLPG
jgi:hypothetical protein